MAILFIISVMGACLTIFLALVEGVASIRSKPRSLAPLMLRAPSLVLVPIDERRAQLQSHGLAENEVAMTQIDQAMAAIGEMDTSQGHAAMDIESAMAELKTIAARAQKIGKT